MSSQPQTIRLNAIDRSYLIAQAQDSTLYFPMSLLTVVKLKDKASKVEIVSALCRLAESAPRLRLGYQLDVHKRRWIRVNDTELATYFADCVQNVTDFDGDLEKLLGELVRFNNRDISQTVNVFVADEYLIMRTHHSFADGRFCMVLMHYLLAELSNTDIERLSLADAYWMPVWRVIWQTPQQGLTVLWRFARSLFGYYEDFQRDTSTPLHSEREPIVSGSEMHVALRTVPAEIITQLLAMKGELSFNTLLQVVIEERLHKLGLIQRPTTFTIPVDLRRYLREADHYYAGNMASQIRVTVAPDLTFEQRAQALQARAKSQLDTLMPLASIPGEWLLALAGDKTYQNVNRDWLLKSTHNDPRFFVLSNIGQVDDAFSQFADVLADDCQPRIVVPLMGAPPLVILYTQFQQCGYFTITYDPQLLTENQIDDLMQIFSQDALNNLAKLLEY